MLGTTNLGKAVKDTGPIKFSDGTSVSWPTERRQSSASAANVLLQDRSSVLARTKGQIIRYISTNQGSKEVGAYEDLKWWVGSVGSSVCLAAQEMSQDNRGIISFPGDTVDDEASVFVVRVE